MPNTTPPVRITILQEGGYPQEVAGSQCLLAVDGEEGVQVALGGEGDMRGLLSAFTALAEELVRIIATNWARDEAPEGFSPEEARVAEVKAATDFVAGAATRGLAAAIMAACVRHDVAEVAAELGVEMPEGE